MPTTSSRTRGDYTRVQVPPPARDHVRAQILNGIVVLLAGWLLVSPLTAGYGGTDASNDVALAQIGAGVVIAATALPRVREPSGHPWLVACTALAAFSLLVFPWLTGAAVNNEPPGLPPGIEDNGYAPFASANAAIASGVVLALTALAWAAAGPSRRTRRSRGSDGAVRRHAKREVR